MAVNLNEADEQMEFGVIPDGTFVKAICAFKPGGYTLPGMDALDNGLFTQSKSPGSDAVMIAAELTIEGGPYAGRKWFENFTVAGGSLDDKGVSKGLKMSKARLRAMVESALGISPKDTSPAAVTARTIQAFSKLHGIPAWYKLGIDPGQDYVDAMGVPKKGRDRNNIERVVVPTDAEYADLRAGKEVPPKSSGVARLPAAAAVAATPAWGTGTAPAQPAATANPAWAAPAAQPTAAASPPPPPAAAAPADLPTWAQATR